MKIKIILILVLILVTVRSFAEYRVFLLKITKTGTSANPVTGTPDSARVNGLEGGATSGVTGTPGGTEGGASRFVESTLDPDQYPAYYPLELGETITYTDTWYCPGRTNGLPLCPNPRAPASTQGLDSANEPLTNTPN